MTTPRDPLAPEANLWHRFCDDLKRAGDLLQRETTPNDELTRAEGYRHLARMIRAGFEASCELADLDHPEIVPMATATLLYEGVTPDARYHHAFIDGTKTYRVSGTRGEAPLFEASVYTGQTGLHPTNDTVSSLTERDLAVEADGRFELWLGPERRAGNWLATGPEARRLFLRQYAHDWSGLEPASYEIACIDASEVRPPVTLDTMREAFERTATFVATAPPFWAGISEYWRGHAVNEIVPQVDADDRTDVTEPTGHRFACGYYELAEHEALEIAFRPVEVPYWGLSLTSYWYEPFHWPDTRSSLNNRSAAAEPDGSIRVVLSEIEPAKHVAPNWLALDGHRQGTIVFRWSRTNEPVPAFETRVVPASGRV